MKQYTHKLFRVWINGTENETFQYLMEDTSKVVFRCAETMPDFERGTVANFEWQYRTSDADRNEGLSRIFSVNNAVLVYINHKIDMGYVPIIEYVFYK